MLRKGDQILSFVVSHPLRKVRAKDGAPGDWWLIPSDIPHLKIEMWGTRGLAVQANALRAGLFAGGSSEILRVAQGKDLKEQHALWAPDLIEVPHLKIEMWGTRSVVNPVWPGRIRGG
jgi:hypothetical protein